MKKNTLTAMLVALIILPMSVSAFAYPDNYSEVLLEAEPVPVYVEGSESEVGDGEYNGYNLYYEDLDDFRVHNIRSWWWEGSNRSGFTVQWVGDYQDYSNATIKVPDKINRAYVISIKGSCDFKSFDLNPENKYMKCVDNVIFSKDGKTLISYAKYDERTEYVIPEGTEIISNGALFDCINLKSVIIPETVKEIGHSSLSATNLISVNLPREVQIIPDGCFWGNEELTSVIIPCDSKLNTIESDAFLYCYKLSELYIPSFDIEIDKAAFGYTYGKSLSTKLKSYVQPTVYNEGNSIKWNNIQGVSYYEIYQKLSSGEYKLMSTTKGTSCKLSSIKSGSEYTLAVKPIAVIPAANYDKEKDEGEYPETFTIEGTMSEDVVVKG